MADGALDGLLNISISDSDESAVEDEKRNKRPRDAQNEDEFQAVRRTYSVKIENGEVGPMNREQFAISAGLADQGLASDRYGETSNCRCPRTRCCPSPKRKRCCTQSRSFTSFGDTMRLQGLLRRYYPVSRMLRSKRMVMVMTGSED